MRGSIRVRSALVGLAALFVAGRLAAQEGAPFRGVVVDAETGTAVAQAEVLVVGTPLRTFSGEDGSFSLVLPAPGPHALVVAAYGYGTVEHSVVPQTPGDEPFRIAVTRQLFEVPGLTVTAGRGAARPGDAPTSVAVIGAEELQRRDVTSLDEALPFAQGVTFNAGQMDIRGSTGIARGVGSRVLMLLDGHRMLSGVSSAINFGILPILDVERIEIVKGPHSTLWGTNAMGGVVNVITRPLVVAAESVVRGYYGVFDTPGDVHFTDERLNMQGLQLQHARRIGTTDLTLFGGRERSDGFRQNGSVDRWHLRAKAVFGAESLTPWAVFATWKREDAQEFFTWRSADRRLEVDPSQLGDWIRNSDLVVGMTGTPLVNSRLQLQIRPQIQHVRVQNHFHDNEDYHRSTRYGTDVQFSLFRAGRNSFTFGGEAAYTGVASNFLDPTPNVTDFALFAQDDITFSETLRGSVGLRLDRHAASFVESDLTLNPKIGLVFQRSDRLSFRTSLSRGYRAPSVSEQFTSTVVFGFRVVPNLQLRGESAWAGEVGLTASPRDWLWFDAGLFWSEYDGLIEVSGAPGQFLTFQFRNVAEARVRGLDAGMRIGLVPRKLNFETNYLLLDSRDLNTDLRLAYRSRHNITTTLSGWTDLVALDLRYRSRPEQVLAFPLDERGAITLVDLRFGMDVRDMEVQAKVANLLQAEYVDVQERNPGATRSFRITVTSRF